MLKTLDSTLDAEQINRLEAHRQRSDHISKIMGDKLLLGWQMLAENCEKCDNILMRDRNSSIHCLACEDQELEINIRRNSATRTPMSPNTQMNDAVNSTFSPASSFRIVEAHSRLEKWRSSIGEYLLRGWVMLNEACDSCGTAILQSKAGVKICAKCPKYSPSLKEEILSNVTNSSSIKPTSNTNIENPSGCLIKSKLRSVVSYCTQKMEESDKPEDINKWAHSIELVGKASTALNSLYS